MKGVAQLLSLFAVSAAAAGSRGGCERFFARLAQANPDCVVTGANHEQYARCISAEGDDECVALVARLRGDSREDADCLGLHPFSSAPQNRIFDNVPTLCGGKVAENATGFPPGFDPSRALEARETWRPTSSATNFRCVFELGKGEEEVPCMEPGEKVYYEVTVDKVRGFEFSVRSEDGSPLGLAPLFRLGVVDDDEVFDCFAADTVDTSTCDNSRITKGLVIPEPLKFESMKLRLGFKQCGGTRQCTKRILSFRTTAGPQVLGDYTAGCTTLVARTTPDSFCKKNGSPAAAAASFGVLAAAVLLLLL